jgi:6-phosphogluconolactonase
MSFLLRLVWKRTLTLTPLTVLAAIGSSATTQWVYMGGFSTDTGKGIYLSQFNPATGALSTPKMVSEIQNPNFLIVNPTTKVLYSIGQRKDWLHPVVDAFSVDPVTGSLKLLTEVAAPASGDCHIQLSRDGKTLLAANYNDGSIATYPVLANGGIKPYSSYIKQSLPKKPNSNAHCIVPDPAGKFVLVANLGLDAIFSYGYNATKSPLTATIPASYALPTGTGPRHLTFSADSKFVYLISELAGTVTVLSYNAPKGSLSTLQTISTLPVGFKGRKWCAEIALSANGKFLYASNRADDETIAVFSVGSDGKLTFLQRFHTASIHQPRHFAIDPTGKWMLIGNADGNTVIVAKVDPAKGTLTATSTSVQFYPPQGQKIP